jgi:hypothetical protein
MSLRGLALDGFMYIHLGRTLAERSCHENRDNSNLQRSKSRASSGGLLGFNP